MVLLKSIILAFIFVITGGELFSRFAKKHKYLAFMAYIILVASGIFVIREIYNELIYIIENVETLSFFYLVKLLTAIAICIIAPMLALSESKAVLEAAEQEPKPQLPTPTRRRTRSSLIEYFDFAQSYIVTIFLFFSRLYVRRLSKSVPSLMLAILVIAEILFAIKLINSIKIADWSWKQWDTAKERMYPGVAEVACQSFMNQVVTIILIAESSSSGFVQRQLEFLRNLSLHQPSTRSIKIAGGQIIAVGECQSGSIYAEVVGLDDRVYILSDLRKEKEPISGQWLVGVAGNETTCRIGNSSRLAIPLRAEALGE